MLEGYEKSVFTTDAVDGEPLAHDVYTKGDGPIILLIQELPGIGPQMLQLADRIVDAGFTVVMPHLFGPLGKLSFVGNIARVFCMRREFSLFSRNKTSPVVNWLKALCAQVKQQHDVKGIGVIGMCLTGNFAISLMADENVLASVSSQPSLPLFGNSSLHMSPGQIEQIKSGVDKNGPMLAYRFKGDVLCTGSKFKALDETFNTDKERIKLRTLEGNKHAILTVHFIDEEGSPTAEALKELIGYFHVALDAH